MRSKHYPGLVSVGWGGVDGRTIKLILDDVVEDLQEEEDQVMVLGGGEEEPGSGEGLQEVEQLGRRHHGQTLQVGRNCVAKKKKIGIAVPYHSHGGDIK